MAKRGVDRSRQKQIEVHRTTQNYIEVYKDAITDAIVIIYNHMVA